MRVFVTGGSSPLGESVLPTLTSSGHAVIALARSREAVEVVRNRGAVPVAGDLQSRDEWASEARRADAVVHLAGVRFVNELLAFAAPGQQLTVISSASARNARHPLARELQTAEKRLKDEHRGEVALLRPTMIYGSSGDRNIRLLARLVARVPAVPRCIGGGFVQPVFVDDVAAAIKHTLGCDVEADLGGPEPLRLGKIIDELARLLRRRSVTLPFPVRPAAWLAEGAMHLRPSRSLHALAMLRHDRIVAAPDTTLLGRDPTPFSGGIRIALARYGIADADAHLPR